MFSKLKLIKTDRRWNLSESSLDGLMRTEMEGALFLSTGLYSCSTVQLWWKDACSRQVQDTRAAPKRQKLLNEKAATVAHKLLY